MCHASICADSFYFIDDQELHRPAPSYTFDTVAALQQSLPAGDTLAWLVGTDHLPRLHTWHRFDELLQRIDFVVMRRPGQTIDLQALDPRVVPLARNAIDVPQLDISSTLIRQRVRVGRSIAGLVPPVVERMIRENSLYLTD
jgi:nicotinate-nucleotide adenylyltransferase